MPPTNSLGYMYQYDDELGAYYYPSSVLRDEPNRFHGFKYLPNHAKPHNMLGDRIARERMERDGLSKWRGLAHDNDSFVPPQRMRGGYLWGKRKDAYIDRMRSQEGGGGFSLGPDALAMPRPRAVREQITFNRVQGELAQQRIMEQHGHMLEALRQKLGERKNEWVGWMINKMRRESMNPGTVEENIEKLRTACGLHIEKVIDRMLFRMRYSSPRGRMIGTSAESVEIMLKQGVYEIMDQYAIPSRRDLPYFYWTKRNARYPWWGTDFQMRFTLA